MNKLEELNREINELAIAHNKLEEGIAPDSCDKHALSMSLLCRRYLPDLIKERDKLLTQQ